MAARASTKASASASANGATPETSQEERVQVEIPPIDVREMKIRLIGDAPIISHKWSDKAKEMMLAKQTKQATPAREAKNPQQDFEDSLYKDADGDFAAPAVWFKSSAVAACRYIDGITMTEARGAFHVIGEFVKIEGPDPTMREDMVRIGKGTADIRYRGEYWPWSVELTISYNRGALSLEQITNLFNVAGFGVGVGEWRPSTDGSYGRFHVETEGEVGSG